MPNYQYTVLQPDGTQIKNTMFFDSERELRNAVQKNGNIVVDIKDKGAMYAEVDFSRRPGPKELGVFCTQVYNVLKAGVPILEAFQMIIPTTTNTKLKKATQSVIDDIQAGMAVSDAMTKHSDIYPLVMIQMIKAGESSGQMVKIFERLGMQFEKEYRLKNNIKKALSYPKMIFAVMTIAVIIVCVVVVPMFVNIFNELNTELPITTKFFIFLSELFTSKWYIMLGFIIVNYAAYKLIVNTEKGKRLIASIKLKLPLFGDLVIKTESANFARVFSTLLSAGKDYPDSLEITKNTIGNVIFREAVERMADNLQQGKDLTVVMKNENIFPELMISMCRIGEETGKVGEMLENAASYFEDETETATLRLTGAIQPIIIIIIGIFVGLLVYSIYSPMFSMYRGIG